MVVRFPVRELWRHSERGSHVAASNVVVVVICYDCSRWRWHWWREANLHVDSVGFAGLLSMVLLTKMILSLDEKVK